MERKTFKFRVVAEWSDHPDATNSPNYIGRLPEAAVLPDGRRVALDNESVLVARWYAGVTNPGHWVVLHADEEGNPVVSEKSRSGGDNPSRPHGRHATTMWVLAPEGTEFVFSDDS